VASLGEMAGRLRRILPDLEPPMQPPDMPRTPLRVVKSK